MPHCEVFNMGYNERSSTNRKAHREHHDQVVNGFRWKLSPKENVVYRRGNFRIVFVDEFSTQFLRQGARKVSSLGNAETNFDGGVYGANESGMAALVGILGDRAIAVIILVQMESCFRGEWSELPRGPIADRDLFRVDGIWGIHFIWIHRRYRGTKILTEMPEAACKIAGLSKNEIPLRAPFSTEFERCWKKYSPEGLTLGWPY